MRLLFLIDHFGSGGAQRQIVNLSLELARRGHDVEFSIYYPSFDHYRRELEEAGILIHDLPKRSRYSISVPLRLRRLLKKHNYDAVLSFLDTPNVYAVLSNLCQKKTAVVVSERSMSQRARPGFIRRIRTNLYRRADHIVTNSHTQREWMIRNFPWIAGRISTIYNGIDLEHFSPIGPPYVLRQRLRLVAIGTLTHSKNALGLLRAADNAQIANHIESITWVGKADKTQRGLAYRKEIESYAANLSTNVDWRWLGERSDIPQIVREHDALIHPSLFEGLPNAACEALACGRPVLISRVGDHPRIVTEGVTGFLFDPCNEDDIRSAINRLIQLSARQYSDMCHRARSFAERTFSLQECAIAYEQVLEDSISIRRGQREKKPEM